MDRVIILFKLGLNTNECRCINNANLINQSNSSIDVFPLLLFLFQSDCCDTTKDSLAAAMRHTRRHAQDTYDKRTANERKSLAFSLASQFAEMDEEGHTAVAHDNRSVLCLGMLVCVCVLVYTKASVYLF